MHVDAMVSIPMSNESESNTAVLVWRLFSYEQAIATKRVKVEGNGSL